MGHSANRNRAIISLLMVAPLSAALASAASEVPVAASLRLDGMYAESSQQASSTRAISSEPRAELTYESLAPSFSLQSAESEQSPPEPAATEVDKSGTNPTLFLRTITVRNEYQRLPNDKSFNLTFVNYIEPLGDRMNIRLKVPFVTTDVSGDTEFGLGDLNLRFNYLAHLDPKQGLLLGTELLTDTASEDYMGRGKWTIAPIATYALFVTKDFIFAPTYQHNISFAGDEDRTDVNESVIDLYLAFTAADKQSWLTIDPAFVIDWESDQAFRTAIEVEYGMRVGSLWGGALNLIVRPGVGIGQDRPFDWNIEVGFSVVGF